MDFFDHIALRHRPLLLVLILFFTASCSDSDNFDDSVLPNANVEKREVLLNSNVEKWDSANIMNYEYTYYKHCYCPPPINQEVVIKVSNHEIQSVFSNDDNVLLDQSLHTYFNTIDDLFSRIQRAINSRDRLAVTYDSEFGYPTIIEIDNSQIADYYLYIRVSKLSVF